MAAGLTACLTVGVAHAEVESIIPAGGQYMQALDIPKLPVVPGWSFDPALSLADRSRVLFPTGRTVDTAPAMIAAQAVPRAAVSSVKALDGVITALEGQIAAADRGRAAIELQPLVTNAGQTLRMYSFRTGEGMPGLVAYGSDATHWLSFTLSVKDPATLADNSAVFRRMLADYR